jgi:hypothetical protein
MAEAEDRATQGCNLSADLGARMEGASEPRSRCSPPSWQESDKSWGSGGQAPSLVSSSRAHLRGSPRRWGKRFEERSLPLFLFLPALLNEIAVVHQLADQGINLL